MGIDTAFSVGLTSHCDKGIEELGFVRAHDSLDFILDDLSFELVVRDNAVIPWINVGYHLVNLVITQINAYLLKYQFELVGRNLPRSLFIK